MLTEIDNVTKMKVEESASPKERKAEVVKAGALNTGVLDCFDLLKKNDEKLLVIGGSRLVSFLRGIEENEKELQYVIQRLVRSVGANKLCMRTGHFASLVVVLNTFQSITVTRLLELVKNELHVIGSSKSEVGDVALGRIIVCSAVFRSGLMLRSSPEEQMLIVDTLVKASKKKNYLVTAAYLVLVDFINTLSEDQFSTTIWSALETELKKPMDEHTLDSLHFLMVAKQKFPETVKIRKFLGVDEILCEDTIHSFCEKLMAVTDFNGTNHPIYDLVGIQIANSEHLELFWTSGIDSQLVKHNRNREIIAIKLLTNIFNNMTDNFEVIPNLLTNNFMKNFLDWFKGLQTASKIRSQRDNEDDNKLMTKKGKELLNSLAKVLKNEKVTTKTRVAVLKKLYFYPGEMNISEVTGTTITRSIIADLDKDGVKKMAKLFKNVLLNNSKKVIKEDTERPWFNNEKLKAAETLSYLVNQISVKDDNDFKLTHMKILLCLGFFKVGGEDNVIISADYAAAIKSSFYRCLNTKLPSVDSLVEILNSLCSFINKNLDNEQIKEKLVKQFPEENMECWSMLNNICETIENVKNKKKIDNVFLILLYQLGLFLFSEPKHVEMAKSSIKELASCYEHYKKDTLKKKDKKKKKIKEGDLYDGEPEWIEVLVEVLLSILSIESSVLRSVVQCVFRLLWEQLTPSSIGQIVSVLDPDSDSNPLVEESDGEGDSSDEDSADEDDKDSDGKESDGETDGGETDIEDADDEKISVPDQLRIAVQKALGDAAQESDAESIDADMIDEEQGKKLDDALADAFKQFQQGKKQKTKKDRKDKKTLADFRIRVLDLIDIYLEKEPAMDICLGMLAPLMRCLEFCIQDSEQRELEHRLRKTLKLLTKVRKFSSNADVDIPLLCDYLNASIDKGMRTHFIFQAVGDMVTECATFIINCSQRINQKDTGPLLDIYKEALKSFFLNRNCLLPSILFHSILQTDWSGNVALVPIIIENTFDSLIRQYKRNEALELLAAYYLALKRIKPDQIYKELESIEKQLEASIRSALDAKKTDFIVKPNFYKTLAKVITNIKKFHESYDAKSEVNFDKLHEFIIASKRVKLHVDNQGKPGIEKENNVEGKSKKNETEGKSKKKKKRKAKMVNGHGEPKAKKIKSQIAT